MDDVEVQALLCYRALVSRDRLLERCPWTRLEDALDPSQAATCWVSDTNK